MTNPAGLIHQVVFDNESNIAAIATSYGITIANPVTAEIIMTKRLNEVNEFTRGIRLISTLGNSNIVAVTAESDSSPNIYIYDYKEKKKLTQYNLNDTIYGIRLRPDLIAVATAKKIEIRTLSSSTPVCSFDTAFNRDGIFDIPSTFSSSLIAFPAPDIGVITIANYLDNSFKRIHVHVFKTPISFIKFSDNGRLLAVAGDDGKNIIVYSVPSMKQVAVLKRGVTASTLLSMSFEPHGTQLAVTSSGGTCHVFYIAWPEPTADQAATPDAVHKDPKTPARASFKLRDSDSHPSWINFSAKTMKLIGLTTTGQFFNVKFDEQTKQAISENNRQPLQLEKESSSAQIRK